MPKYSLDHVHLYSPDPVKTAKFYEKMFGAKRESVGKLGDGRDVADFNISGTIFRVSQPRAKPMIADSSGAGYALEHFGLRTDNLEAAMKELKAQGMKFLQGVTTPRPGVKVTFFLTSEDVLVELMEKAD